MVFGRSRAHYLVMETNTHKIYVGARLRLTIDALERSQATVAQQLDISPSKLHNWIRGVNYPEIPVLIKLCDRYGLTMDWFLRGQLAGVAGDLGDALSKVDVAF